jgi:hypothetical protein
VGRVGRVVYRCGLEEIKKNKKKIKKNKKNKKKKNKKNKNKNIIFLKKKKIKKLIYILM